MAVRAEGYRKRELRKGEHQSKKKCEEKSKERKGDIAVCVGGGGGYNEKDKEQNLRHPIVSPGIFLCTKNDCTRSRSRILEGGGVGAGVHSKTTEWKEGACIRTWSTVQLTDLIWFPLFKRTCA